MQLLFDEQTKQFTFTCLCGHKTLPRYTVEAAGRLADLHMAVKFPIGTQRKPCQETAYNSIVVLPEFTLQSVLQVIRPGLASVLGELPHFGKVFPYLHLYPHADGGTRPLNHALQSKGLSFGSGKWQVVVEGDITYVTNAEELDFGCALCECTVDSFKAEYFSDGFIGSEVVPFETPRLLQQGDRLTVPPGSLKLIGVAKRRGWKMVEGQ